jgi:hypothetical protein
MIGIATATVSVFLEEAYALIPKAFPWVFESLSSA